MRRFRSLVLVVALVAVPLAAENGRDLAKAAPESVGVSSERLRRLDAGMQKFVDEGRLAGVTTLLARRGKIINANAYGRKNAATPEPIQRDSIFRIYVPKPKLARLARIHTDGPGGTIAPPTENADEATVPPQGPSGGGGLYSTSDDYLRFAQMLLNGGELGSKRYLSPRTVQMMRTNHLHADALKTVRPGTGWGMDFRVVMDAAAAGEPTADGTFDWFGLAGTWFWIDPVSDLVFVGMIQHRGRVNSEIQGLSRNLALLN